MSATNEVLQEGRYRIEQQLPQVGESNVFAAYDTVRDTKVVVKEIVLKLNRVTTPTQQEQMITAFSNQARLLTEAKHDALLNVHDYFSEIGRQYLVIESIEGRDLSALLKSNPAGFPVNDVCRWADQLLDALGLLHKFSPAIIHKNIRPGHIQLTPDRKVKLLSFGLIGGSDTKINATLGSDVEGDEIAYSPIEQIWENLDSASQKVISSNYNEQEERDLSAPLDARSDIYSLGATLYHFLTGNRPVDSLERSIEMLDGKADPLADVSKINPKVPKAVSDLVMRSLHIKRNDRFASAEAMRRALSETGVLTAAAAPAPATLSAPANPAQPPKPVVPTPVATPQTVNPPTLTTLEPIVQLTTTPTPAQNIGEVLEMPSAPSATVEDFHSVLTVDHDGADQTAHYDVESAQSVSKETDVTPFENNEDEPFSFASGPRGFSLPIPAIAGAFALVLVVAIGGYFMLSSGSGKGSPQVETQLSVQPAPAQEQPAPAVETESSVVSADQPMESAITSDAVTDQPAQTAKAAKTAPTKTPKPSANAAKQPEKKKTLTVDDLIRDN